MSNPDVIATLDDEQRSQLETYPSLLARFNQRINLISPRTAGDIWTTHIQHSLAIAMHPFPEGARIVDWGTGGGLPLIPLAICFPQCFFTGVDAVGKKVQAVRAMSRTLGLTNVEVWHGRAEAWAGKAHYSVSRATAPLERLWSWHRRCAEPFESTPGACWPPGLLCLKGGDLHDEQRDLEAAYPGLRVTQISLDSLARTPILAHVFAEKYLLLVQS